MNERRGRMPVRFRWLAVAIGAAVVVFLGVRLSTWISEDDRLTDDSGPAAPARPGEDRSTVTAGGPSAGSLPPLTTVGDLEAPVRAIFYYPWFPEAWSQQDREPFAHYLPQLGLYDSSADDVIRSHIATMRYAGLDAGISSWWGPGTATDRRFSRLLDLGEQERFPWAPYYEGESLGDPSPGKIRADLDHLVAHYGQSVALAHLDDRILVFVFGDARDGCAAARRWREGRRSDVFIVLKVFEGYRECADQPDGWHQYAPAQPYDEQLPYSVTVSPGFWSAAEATPRLERDIDRWRADVRRMASSDAQFQLVTSFNEWGEGTAIEPAPDWASNSGNGLFVDILRDEFDRA